MGKTSSVAKLTLVAGPFLLVQTFGALIWIAWKAPEVTLFGAIAGTLLGLLFILGAKLQKLMRGNYLSFGTESQVSFLWAMSWVGYGLIALSAVAYAAVLVVVGGYIM